MGNNEAGVGVVGESGSSLGDGSPEEEEEWSDASAEGDEDDGLEAYDLWDDEQGLEREAEPVYLDQLIESAEPCQDDRSRSGSPLPPRPLRTAWPVSIYLLLALLRPRASSLLGCLDDGSLAAASGPLPTSFERGINRANQVSVVLPSRPLLPPNAEERSAWKQRSHPMPHETQARTGASCLGRGTTAQEHHPLTAPRRPPPQPVSRVPPLASRQCFGPETSQKP